ncbi:hypothetical protein BCR33DRAFT_715943 [Rhizoclosmatium globosum]|uniref:Auxin efflux carrier n=1 Tax=Rhizoclosmatium globosum TaxID=329046 RepID=A0A1Y2CFR9_9FUNG|nr:hypothetical protein BCR33DRAFT_715943 [Rhizoclosmatium globosum]|eukprot:ORY45918.1 hypothetical protein BCR33DRAFT_715943 [Rhizoclosmatium globosum]
MPNINLTGPIVWAACRPILKLIFAMGIGVFMAKNKVLEASGSKVIAKVLNPCLLFSNVVVGINFQNLYEFGVMNLASMCHLSLGWILGCIGFRYGTISLAIILSLGNTPPFQPVGYTCFGIDVAGMPRESVGGRMSVVSAAASVGATVRRLSRNKELSGRFSMDGVKKEEESGGGGEVRRTVVDRQEGFDEEDGMQFTKEVAQEGGDAQIAVQDQISVIGPHTKSEPNKKRADDAETVHLEHEFQEEDPIKVTCWTVLKWLWMQIQFALTSLLSPANTATIVGLFVASIPALKGLFVKPQNHFLIEALQFLGGGARLVSPKIIIGISLCRLVVMPLLVSGGVIDADDKMFRFVLMLEACMPTASSTVYFTQMWHPKGEADAIAGVILVQYCLGFVCLTLSLSVILSLLS